MKASHHTLPPLGRVWEVSGKPQSREQLHLPYLGDVSVGSELDHEFRDGV